MEHPRQDFVRSYSIVCNKHGLAEIEDERLLLDRLRQYTQFKERTFDAITGVKLGMLMPRYE